jgi:hypothetical protein
LKLSSLELKFLETWQTFAPDLVLGCQFKDERIRGKSRCMPFDFHVLGTRILIEVQGGTGFNSQFSAHKTCTGMKRDCTKINKAQALGYICFAVTTGMVTHKYIKELISYVRNLQAQGLSGIVPPSK